MIWLSFPDCSPPIITMIPSTSSLSSPLQFSRGEDFYIAPYVYLQCKASLATTVRWTISRCTSVCSSLPLWLSPSVTVTAAELFVPARTLDVGTYILRMKVAMVAAPHLIATDSVYVTITPSTITPNLMPFGTSTITHGRAHDLLLDPGAYSDDPDALTFNATVSLHGFIAQLS